MSDSNMQGISPLGFIAGGTIAQYRAVKLDSTVGQVVAASAITDNVVGVSLISATSGLPVTLQTAGKVKVTASAAITLGDQVMVTASGAGKVSTASGATAKSIGIALEAAGADGDIIEVLLQTPNVNGPANT